MKKKIILFLSVLLVAMFVTGCSTTTTTADELSKLNDVANEVAREAQGYKLPDGYNLAYPDSKDPSRISITGKVETENNITAEYVIDGKEACLDSFEIEDIDAVSVDSMFAAFLIGFVVGIVIMLVMISAY